MSFLLEGIHDSVTNREAIAVLSRGLRPEFRFTRAQRQERHHYFRRMLSERANWLEIVEEFRL